MTPEQVKTFAHQASTYACQALLSNDRWQEVRDQKFAELVEAETLRRAAEPDLTKLTERGAKAWAGMDAQALREGHGTPGGGPPDDHNGANEASLGTNPPPGPNVPKTLA